MPLAIVDGHDDAHSWTSAHARTSASHKLVMSYCQGHRLTSWRRPNGDSKYDIRGRTNSTTMAESSYAERLLERRERSSVHARETNVRRLPPDGERPRTPNRWATRRTTLAAR